jgi:hypothetical protein
MYPAISIQPREMIYKIERPVKNTSERTVAKGEEGEARREYRLKTRYKRQILSLPTTISFIMLSLPIYFNLILLVR